ncbi:unnamed protein product [Lepeophtheirus salmonis]|uniref:(salmon louse) hypothetical protein n=1 Tax=Lepeophtheirus salmonis TaxID=72036 RepID=A0A7R8H624_LEPSM|nr:unnamed protein product [Lepeophtheirus salmonis]CAF2893780.1 unnamed protein product [Lepeophtheirus salmonis]
MIIDKQNINPVLKPYAKILPHLTIDDDLIIFGDIIIIPGLKRDQILQLLQSTDIRNLIEPCEECPSRRSSLHKELLKSDPTSRDVFQKIATDFFEVRGKHYLAIVDPYSNFLLVHKFSSTPTSNRKTQNFFACWGIAHRRSSPHFPQINGLAKSAFKPIKALLLKTGNTESEAFQEGYSNGETHHFDMAHCPHPKLSSEDQCHQDSLLITYHLPMIGRNASTNMTDASPNSMSTQATTLTIQQICSKPSLLARRSGSKIQLPKSGIGQPPFKARSKIENIFSSFHWVEPYVETDTSSGSSKIART